MIVSLLLGIPQDFNIDARVVKSPDDLLKQPVVVYVDDITEAAAKVFEENMLKAQATGQPIIPIVIDSYGGSVYALFEMVDVLQSMKVPVSTIVQGKAMSAGAVLAACGAEGMRFAYPNSVILLHDVSSAMQGKMSELVSSTEEIKRLNGLLFKIVSEHTGKPNNYFLDLIQANGRADLYLTPEEALKHNLINKIKVPVLKTKVVMETVLE